MLHIFKEFPRAFRTNFLYFAILISCVGCGSQVVKTTNQTNAEKSISSIRSIDPADAEFSDMKALGNAVADARIVLLGEATHGEGSTFLAKTRIIKYLHEKKGFDVLAFESGFYDCARIWENTVNGGTLSKEVIGSLFYMYATSKQMMSLFDYVQSNIKSPHPLTLTGFESQHSGLNAKNLMFPDFEKYLSTINPSLLDSSWRLFKRISLATINSRAYRPTAEEKNIYFNKLELLKKQFEAKSEERMNSNFAASPGFWYRVLCCIESQTKRYWEMVEGNEVSVRDLQMANNLIWLAEKVFPGKKIIVWAHNGHISKGMKGIESLSGSPDNFTATFVPMGVTIKNYFGDKAYHIGFTGSEGTYMNFVDSKIITVLPAPKESIEGKISATGFEYAFVDYHHTSPWFQSKQQGRLSDFGNVKAKWGDVFDGLFFIKKVFPVDRNKSCLLPRRHGYILSFYFQRR